MRLIKLGVYSENYLRGFYRRRPGLSDESYSHQFGELIKDRFGSSDFWTHALNEIGYEAREIISNARPLQMAWAAEDGTRFAGDGWLDEIALAQIVDFRPEILLVADYSTFTADFIERVRSACPSIRLVAGWCAAPYSDGSVFSAWDLVLSSVPELVNHFVDAGHRSFHVNHAFDGRVLGSVQANPGGSGDFVFAGSVNRGEGFHRERERLLLRLVEHTNLEICADLPRPSRRERRGVYLRRTAYSAVNFARAAGVSAENIGRLPLAGKVAAWPAAPSLDRFVDDRILSRTQPAIYGLEMYRRLKSADLVLNNHIDISSTYASNMRLFEATGVGACLLTDRKENIEDLFEPDHEVLTYGSAEECVEKVRYILEHDRERREIGAAAERRAARDHTFADRASRLDEILRGAIGKAR